MSGQNSGWLLWFHQEPRWRICCQTFCSSHRYGVKGPVYLRNREGQVVSVGPDGACQWKSGSIQKHSDHIISSSGDNSTTFRLFDHITVSPTTG